MHPLRTISPPLNKLDKRVQSPQNRHTQPIRPTHHLNPQIRHTQPIRPTHHLPTTTQTPPATRKSRMPQPTRRTNRLPTTTRTPQATKKITRPHHTLPTRRRHHPLPPLRLETKV